MKMKKIIITILLISGGKSEFMNYYPLEVGNEWSYETGGTSLVQYSMDSVYVVNGTEFYFNYFIGHGMINLAWNIHDDDPEDGNRLYGNFHFTDTTFLLLDLDQLEVNNSNQLTFNYPEIWGVEAGFYISAEFDPECSGYEIPAGDFQDCVVIRMSYDFVTDSNMNIWFAPGVGPVFYLIGMGMWGYGRLAEAVIGGEALTIHENLPLNCGLLNSYPNPFNAASNITFSLSKMIHVQISIFDMIGHPVQTLTQGERSPGDYTIHWNAENLPSGTYFIRLQTDDFIQTQKAVLVK